MNTLRKKPTKGRVKKVLPAVRQMETKAKAVAFAPQIVSPLVTHLPWSRHLIILSQAKPAETRESYLLAAIRERCGEPWRVRALYGGHRAYLPWYRERVFRGSEKGRLDG